MKSGAPNTLLNVESIRREFPILSRTANGKPLVYFDNAATSQKPLRVINALAHYYQGYNANIHRGLHTLASEATQAYESARVALQHFVNATDPSEIIFTKGVTESINLVACSYGRAFVGEGDEILISEMEHHSNIVPWQMLCEAKKAVLRVAPISDRGEIDLDAFKELLTERTRIVATCHASNSLGTVNPICEIIHCAHQAGAVALIDGAQAGAHLPIDVQALDADFYCLSAHKMYGPTGIGALYGKQALLNKMPPYMGGGEMIQEVTFAKTTYNELPYKFEAGTPHIAGAIGFGEALAFLHETGREAIAQHEDDLLQYATVALGTLDGVALVGEAAQKVGVLSFVVNGVHPFDVGQLLNAQGVAVRTGHHCTQPLMERLGIEGTVRSSFAMYNTRKEIDIWVESMKRIVSRTVKRKQAL